MSALTAVPPFVVVLAAAVLAWQLPRRVGHAVGVLATGAIVPWTFAVPAGAHYDVTFLGFDAVLLNVDDFSRLMGLIFGLIGAVAVLYSYASDADRVQTAFALSYVGTSLGAVFAGDWLTLVFFWELMAVTSTLLVWHYGGAAVRAGFRYALLHALGGSLLMGAVLWLYVAREPSTFLFASIAEASIEPGMLAGGAVPATLAALGIGVNVGFVGLHTWLPDTYPRPHFAASVFLCVFTTKTGVYGMYRAFPDGHLWIAYMGTAMAVFGVTYALLQNDMRRLLSYHIQSQVGYMVAGVGLAGVAVTHDAGYAALAEAGAFAHVYNHILYKSLLFMTAGVVIYRTGEENLKKLGGLAREMPITAGAFTVAALSIAGFPYFNGFVSKGMITAAAHGAHLDVIYYLLLLGGVGTFMSFVKFGYYAFFHGEYDGSVADANWGQAVAMGVVALLCVFYGVFYEQLFAILPSVGAADPHPYTTSHILEGLTLATLGVVGFFVLKKPLGKLTDVPDVDAVLEPGTFYGARALVVAVTDAYAAVDRVAVATAAAVATPIRSPTAAAERVPVLGTRLADGDGPAHPLRASIGLSVLVLATVVTVGLLAFSL